MNTSRTVVLIAVLAIAGIFLININRPERAENGNPQQQVREEFLDLSELGVRLPLEEGLKGLLYQAREFTAGTTTNVAAMFSSVEVLDKAREVNDEQALRYCTQADAPLGAVVRTSRKPEGDERPLPPDAREIDGAYIYYEGPQAACATNEEVLEIMSKQIGQLREAVKGAQKIQ